MKISHGFPLVQMRHCPILLLSAAFALLVLLAALSPAQAQRKLRVALGGGFKSLSYRSSAGPSTVDSGSNNPIVLGISYDVGGLKISPGDIPVNVSAGDIDVISVDIKAQELLPLAVYSDTFVYDSIFGSGVQVTSLGATLRKRNRTVYFGGGAGLYQTRIPDDVFRLDDAPVGSRNQIRPGIKLFVGVEASSLFVEAGYTQVFSGAVNPGASLVVGLRL